MAESFRKKLINRIWWTKKIRMESEQRLLKLAKRNSFLNIYYSSFILIASLLSYTKPEIFSKNIDSDLLILIFSILLTIFSVYTANNRYLERADQMKECYTSLTVLEGRLALLKDDEFEKIDAINVDYQNIMNKVENHLEEDFLVLKEEKKFDEWIKYIYLILKRKLLTLITVVLPIIVVAILLNINSAKALKVNPPDIKTIEQEKN
ncbi:hypothetical protein PM10SUCC1_16460 [Propionigenium maris DSM 9537]|uniref:SMODS and SLOG-associating 2TM effector domain-containing protein n=1 Tax=Propionigenium maris DSM 9537 TaxID=1123000 RepID=A0A9W6LMZ6_9FUSO|nr:SLATT domain-containing protein [Propionigenium maris]GLI56132.1 hypothetical protein PM10SUCC1_16460 [Propionigenium maris DSM 9537]